MRTFLANVRATRMPLVRVAFIDLGADADLASGVPVPASGFQRAKGKGAQCLLMIVLP